MRLPLSRRTATLAVPVVGLLVATSTFALSGTDALSTSTSTPAQLSVVAGTLGPPLDVTASVASNAATDGPPGSGSDTNAADLTGPAQDRSTVVTGTTSTALPPSATRTRIGDTGDPPAPPPTTVVVSWTGPVGDGGPSPDGYVVTKRDGSTTSAACGSSPSDLLGSGARDTHLTCTDTVAEGGAYTYTVTAVAGPWTSSASSSAVTVATTAGGRFAVTSDAPHPTAGTAFHLTVTALDDSGATDLRYAGPRCIDFSAPDRAQTAEHSSPTFPQRGACATGSAVTFSGGTATVSVTLAGPQVTTISVTDAQSGRSGTSPTLEVAAATTSDAPTDVPTTTTTLPSTTTDPPPPVTTTAPPVTTTSDLPPPVTTTSAPTP